jgi:hypothetical protein
MTALALLVTLAHAEPGATPGLAASHLTIAPGFAQAGQTTMYLHGGNALMVANKVALKTDGYVFVGTQTGEQTMVDNHGLFSGCAWHPMTGRFDPYVAVQPGLALTRSTWDDEEGTHRSRLLVTPMASGAVGSRVHMSNFFHLFGEVRQVWGRHLSDDPAARSLSETRMSFGLGAHLDLRRDNARGGST